MLDELSIVVLVQLVLHLVISVIHRKQWMAHIKEKELMWAAERKDLISRVMAPDLQSYTNSVVKVKNAEKPKEEVQPLEFVG